MSEELICPICGEPTFLYYGRPRKDRLCTKCASRLRAGNIFINDEGLFVDSETNKILNANYEEPSKKYTELPREGFNSCLACGQETTGYAFCRECYYEYTLDEMLDILNNPQSNKEPPSVKPVTTNDNNEQSKQPENTETTLQFNNAETLNPVIIINENNKSKCITCGKQADGLLFCGNCYHKYKNKELLFRITNCTNVELLDEDYEGRYTCIDGHIVKSKSERDIDNYLFRVGIQHAYEKKLPYGAKSNEILHPDFYLPHYLGQGKHVYIEHWGYNENNIHYTKTKKFKMPIYKQLGITLICTYERSDSGDIDAVLERKLNKAYLREGEINFENE